MLRMASSSVEGPAHQRGINPEEITAIISQKKSRKKKHQDAQDASEVTEKKKKRKHRNIEATADATVHELNLAPESGAPAKKRRKNKDAPTEPPASSSEVRDATAILSAIVAAAAGHLPSQFPSHLDPQLVPQSSIPYSPPVNYPYYGSHPDAQSGLANPNGVLPFSDLAFTSNDDVLRALQDIDMGKIANVLKALGEATAAAGTNVFIPPTPDGQASARIASSSCGPKVVSKTTHKRTIDMSLPGNEQHTDSAHAHQLAHQWLSAQKLAELVRTEGLVYKKGKFSAIEEEQLNAAIEQYRGANSLTNEDIQAIIFPKNEKVKNNAFWAHLTCAVPQRPIMAVYHHVRRSHHPMKQQGSWKPSEDDLLKQAVTDLGQQWEKVSLRVGRMSSDCRDRYRNHILNREVRVNGPWSKEEEDKLTKIVTDMTVKQGRDIDNDVFWGKVSDMMGNSRGRQQCRIKWTDALSKTVKNQGEKPRWSQQDAFILIHKIDSLNVRDDSEIDWKTISDSDWNFWSAHTLQRRWLTMKRSLKGFEEMTHQEIMDILRIKKANPPSFPALNSRKRKERKVTSAAAISESGDATSGQPEPGSTTEIIIPSIRDRAFGQDDSSPFDSDS